MSIKNIAHFMREGLWTMDEHRLACVPRHALRTLRQVAITVRCFVENNLASLASALTYNCLLAFVPVLSIVFALARGFGLGNEIEERLRENMSAQSSNSLSEDVLRFIDQYIAHTHSGVFLGAGLLILLFTITNLSSSIETAFNTIWHVRQSRNMYRRVLDYTAVFILFPLLIMVSSGFSVFLVAIAGEYSDYIAISRTMTFLIRYTPLILSMLCFVALFKFMPNTEVRWRAVLVPGILAGILFQGLQYLYLNYQIKLSSYNAIYGSFAALPLFMLWLQFSWYICLSCGQLSYAIQHGDDFLFARDSANLPRRDHDAACLYLMRALCQRFAQGEKPHTVKSLTEETGLPLLIVRGMVDELVEARLLSELYNSEGTESTYQPAADLSRITANYVMQQLDSRGQGQLATAWTKSNEAWKTILRQRTQIELTDGDAPLVSTR